MMVPVQQPLHGRQLVLAAAVLAAASAVTPCDKALLQVCDSARKQGFFECAACTGTNQAAIDAAGCDNSDIHDFCQNKTCVTQLSDTCEKQANDCDACTACAGRVKLCKNQPDDQTHFCRTSCDARRKCELKLESLCEADRAQGTLQCAECSGAHQLDLQLAGCSGATIQNFCKDQTCFSKLAQKCHHKIANQAGATCMDCARCAQVNRKKTGCYPADEQAFCDTIAPAATHTPSCHATLTQFCGDDREDSFFNCVACSGAHSAVVAKANCTTTTTTNFCDGSAKDEAKCVATLLQHCKLGSECGSCTDCVVRSHLLPPPTHLPTPPPRSLSLSLWLSSCTSLAYIYFLRPVLLYYNITRNSMNGHIHTCTNRSTWRKIFARMVSCAHKQFYTISATRVAHMGNLCITHTETPPHSTHTHREREREYDR